MGSVMAGSINEERIKKSIEEILERIQAEVDPDLLTSYRSILRKEISFFRRSYFAAYLLMLLDQGGLGKRVWSPPSKTDEKRSPRGTRGEASNKKSSRPSSGENPQAEPNRNPLPEEDSTRLFISIGRNRRVFPREIMGLITAKAPVSREDIGIIRILDNYSFVQVRLAAADAIIEALNGILFRGRTLTVNFARTKKEEEERGLSAERTAASVPPDEAPAETPFEDTFSESEAENGDGENTGE
jgi:hypothetical protein